MLAVQKFHPTRVSRVGFLFTSGLQSGFKYGQMVLDNGNRREVVVGETKVTTGQGRHRTRIEQVTVLLFAVLIVLCGVLLFQWHEHTQTLKSIVRPVNNGDNVCDEMELTTARLIDQTPCGRYLDFLVSLSRAI
jgi:hypothetical protein